jgi:hypothetical protein
MLQESIIGRKSNEKDALDEDLVASKLENDQKESDFPKASSGSSCAIALDGDDKETFDRWRGRLWPSKAIISYVRVLTRCQPPITFIGEKICLGKNFIRYYGERLNKLKGVSEVTLQREGNQLCPHWRPSDLPSVGTFFDSAQSHSSTFFLHVVEESRAALSSQYDEAEVDDELSEHAKDADGTNALPQNDIFNKSKNGNGWLEGEIASIVEETPLGHLPDACHDSRLGSVWVVSLLINASNVNILGAVASKQNNSSFESTNSRYNQNGIDSAREENVMVSGGDIIVIHSNQWDKSILGIVQPWDPDYDIKFGSNSNKLGMMLSGRKHQNYIMMNIMVCIDGGDGISESSTGKSQDYDLTRSGWAAAGMIFPGVHVSLATLGNAMTYIRECQALLSLRMLNSRLRSAILRPVKSLEATNSSEANGTSSLELILDSSKHINSQIRDEASLNCVPRKLWAALSRTFNSSQFHALQAIIARDSQNRQQLASPIHLLQGPPGTGKTKTILGILSVLFAGGLPPIGRVGKGQRVVPGASIISNQSKVNDSNYSSGIHTTDNSLNLPVERDPRRPRILICAPSNTAVDELVYRIITQGIMDENGVQRTDYVQVTRIGIPNRDEYIKKNQGQVFRRKSYSYNSGNNNSIQETSSRSELSLQEVTMIQAVENVCLDNLVESKRRQLSTALSANAAAPLSASFVKTGHVFTMSSQQARTGGQQVPQPQLPAGFRIADLRRQVLEQVDIVCCTLSGAGSQPILENLLRIPHYQFDAVIIDEAAQTVEPSSLIPLKFNPQLVVMVGDPCQLPPTIFSSASKQANYGQSLFERLQLSNQVPLSILATQYRMHPAIAAYPAQRFYNGHLFHGHLPSSSSSISELSRKPYYSHPSGRFLPLVFHDIAFGNEEYDAQQSVMNSAEARYVLCLYDQLTAQYAKEFSKENLRMGIIVPYRGQRRLLQRLFKERYGKRFQSGSSKHPIDTEISTVDGFQGREKDIIIFSCVRAPNIRNRRLSTKGSIGFLKDWRRLNVAITRAKSALWIVGDGTWLSANDPEWNSLISYIKNQSISNGIGGDTQYIRITSPIIGKTFTVPLAEHLEKYPVRLTDLQQRLLDDRSSVAVKFNPDQASTAVASPSAFSQNFSFNRRTRYPNNPKANGLPDGGSQPCPSMINPTKISNSFKSVTENTNYEVPLQCEEEKGKFSFINIPFLSVYTTVVFNFTSFSS